MVRLGENITMYMTLKIAFYIVCEKENLNAYNKILKINFCQISIFWNFRNYSYILTRTPQYLFIFLTSAIIETLDKSK